MLQAQMGNSSNGPCPIKDVLDLVQVRILVGFYVSLGEGIRHRESPHPSVISMYPSRFYRPHILRKTKEFIMVL